MGMLRYLYQVSPCETCLQKNIVSPGHSTEPDLKLRQHLVEVRIATVNAKKVDIENEDSSVLSFKNKALSSDTVKHEKKMGAKKLPTGTSFECDLASPQKTDLPQLLFLGGV